MNKIILSTIAAMLMGGSAYAGNDVIAPPVLKYQESVPMPPRTPDNFGKNKYNKSPIYNFYNFYKSDRKSS